MANSIYFASTTLHLYVASAIAASRPGEDAHLIFIDQPESKPYPLYDIVRNWPGSPFSSVSLFYGRFPGLFNKLRKRRQLFAALSQKLMQLRPEHIFTGNDRRIEFQFAMHKAKAIGSSAIGHYMDEGVFTYLGRDASSSFSDRIIDNSIKKIIYGLWWKNPPTVGASDWITYVHPAFPELIHPLLRKKRLVPLNAASFNSKAMQSLSESILLKSGIPPESLGAVETFITLPHESIFENEPLYRERIAFIVRQQTELGKAVAVKYHPRNKSPDSLDLSSEGIHLLPAEVSFEALLPYLSSECEILGDLSSTMIMARWLRPDLKVNAFSLDNSSFGILLRTIGISKYT
ncbi:polysialyltransferase family glycosyltransferase [Thalassolituus sp. LLYu03]|uniref:polysialyltransferase family glycosyltransferase n=1 Tax=Thalassolituus sp. LLYu03 TaxID=3421656 RepID=UPI003D285618